MLVGVVKPRIESGNAGRDFKCAAVELRNVGEDRCTRCSAGHLIAKEAMPVDLRSVVEGCKTGNVIVHAVGRMYDGLATAAGRPGESEPRRNVAVVVRYAARERIGREVIEGGEKDDLIPSACVDAEIGGKPNLILRKKIQEVEGDADFGVAVVAGEIGVAKGLAGCGIGRTGNGVLVLVKRADGSTAVLSGEAAEAEGGCGSRQVSEQLVIELGAKLPSVATMCPGQVVEYAAAALRGSGGS